MKEWEPPLQDTDRMFGSYSGFREFRIENLFVGLQWGSYRFLVGRNHEIHRAVRTVADYVLGLTEVFGQLLHDPGVSEDPVIVG